MEKKKKKNPTYGLSPPYLFQKLSKMDLFWRGDKIV